MKPCIANWNSGWEEVLNLNIEIGVDVLLIPHVLDDVQHGTVNIILLSNDTDVVVLCLHYWHLLKSHGLKDTYPFIPHLTSLEKWYASLSWQFIILRVVTYQ